MSAFGIVMLFITAAIVINFVSYYFGVWKGETVLNKFCNPK
jgi:membrane protein DedA with SNARE-associated domain